MCIQRWHLPIWLVAEKTVCGLVSALNRARRGIPVVETILDENVGGIYSAPHARPSSITSIVSALINESVLAAPGMQQVERVYLTMKWLTGRPAIQLTATFDHWSLAWSGADRQRIAEEDPRWRASPLRSS